MWNSKTYTYTKGFTSTSYKRLQALGKKGLWGFFHFDDAFNFFANQTARRGWITIHQWSSENFPPRLNKYINYSNWSNYWLFINHLTDLALPDTSPTVFRMTPLIGLECRALVSGPKLEIHYAVSNTRLRDCNGLPTKSCPSVSFSRWKCRGWARWVEILGRASLCEPGRTSVYANEGAP